MSFQINHYVRPSVLSLKPYASARHDFSGQAEIFLDANENSLGSPKNEGLHRYPDPYQTELRNLLAHFKGVSPNQIFFGNGSDEPIDLLIRAFCRPGIDHIIVQPPTYSMYSISAAINEVEVLQVPLQPDFQPDGETLLKSIHERTKIVFFCSPNNPSGNLMKREIIEQVLNKENCLVVVDEAYIDFADEPSFIGQLNEHTNLVVLQTFSKAWGLAAARLGILFAHEAIIHVLNKIKPPYNISLLSQNAGIKALNARDAVARKINIIKNERQRLISELQKISLVKTIYPSDANFLLVRLPDANSLYRQLTERGIIVRNRSQELHCDDCLRITIGTPEENNRLIDELKQLSQEP